MLKKLRRGSSTTNRSSTSSNEEKAGHLRARKMPLPRQDSMVSTSSTASAPTTTPSTITTGGDGQQGQPANFLSLPPELRNEIYSQIAKSTTLTLKSSPRSSKSNSPKISQLPSPPPLLLVSKRIRGEALPIFLSTCPLSAHVTDFNFAPLMRVSNSLYATERRALRLNRQLTVLMSPPAKASDEDVLASLRRWLTFCMKNSSGQGGLSWSYAVYWGEEDQDAGRGVAANPEPTEPAASGSGSSNDAGDASSQRPTAGSKRFRERIGGPRRLNKRQKRKVLLSSLDGMTQLEWSLEEGGLRWELSPLLEAFERELERLPYGQAIPIVACGDPSDQW